MHHHGRGQAVPLAAHAARHARARHAAQVPGRVRRAVHHQPVAPGAGRQVLHRVNAAVRLVELRDAHLPAHGHGFGLELPGQRHVGERADLGHPVRRARAGSEVGVCGARR